MHAYEAEVVVPRSRVLDLMNHPEHPSGEELWLRSTLDPMAFGFFLSTLKYVIILLYLLSRIKDF